MQKTIRGVSEVFQRLFRIQIRGVSEDFQKNFRGISEAFQISEVFQRVFRGVSEAFQRFLLSVQNAISECAAVYFCDRA